MNKQKLLAARGLLVVAVLALAVMGFRMPYEPERIEMHMRSEISQPARVLEALAMIPAVTDGTHYEIPLALVEARGL